MVSQLSDFNALLKSKLFKNEHLVLSTSSIKFLKVCAAISAHRLVLHKVLSLCDSLASCAFRHDVTESFADGN